MNKKFLILLLLLNNQLIKCGTNVFVQNNTPYPFSVNIEQKGKPLSKKYWSKGATKIIPWGKKTKVLQTGRDTKIRKNRRFFYNIHLKPNIPNVKKPLTLRVQLRGKNVGSYIWKTINKDKWYKDNKVHKYNYSINNKVKLEILHKFYEAGTFNDILFVINPKDIISKKYNTKDSQKITILAYNLFNLNPFFKDSPGITERSKIVPQAIKDIADPDVIIFSESFHDDGRKEILKGLKKSKYGYATCVVGAGFHMKEAAFDKPIEQPYIIDFNSSKFKTDKQYQQAGEGDPPSGLFKGGILDGGVIIVSKYPILKAWEIIYKDSKGADTHAKKGAVYAKINKDGKNYHVFGTHTQASYDYVTEYSDIRKKQFASLKKFVNKMKIPNDEPVFIGGDLNIDLIDRKGKKEVDSVLKQLNCSLPTKIGYPYGAHDVKTNCFFKDTGNPRYLDYILYAKDHLQPKKATAEILIPRTKNPWSSWKDGKFDLSDHYPVLGYFEF